MNSNDSNLLDEVKDTLNAITALKNGKPTVMPEVKVEEESTEEVIKDEAVEETKDATEEVKTEATDEVVAEVTEEKAEEAKEESEEVEESAKDTETKEEETEAETEKSVKEETITKFASASDVSEILNAVKELTSYVSTLSVDIEALKSAKTSRKGIMPENEVEEVQEDKNAKLIKQADYIFGK